MSFTPNIPANGQSLGSSRVQVLDNFAVLRSTLAANHVDVNSANPGLHTHADLLAQSADPDPATGIVSHYSKLVSGITEWFFQRENSGSVIQMSNGTPVSATTGQTFLPGGILFQWGTCTVNPSGSTITSFTSPFPTSVFFVLVFSNANAGTVYSTYASSITLTGFKGVSISSPTITTNAANYIALGN